MNDDLFASNIKIQNKIFVNFFVFAKTSKQNRTIFVRKIFRNNKKTKKKCKKTPPQGTKSGKSKHKNIETVKPSVSDPESGSEGSDLIGREHFPP